MFTSSHKLGPRAEYRHKHNQRVKAAPTLAEKYRKLKGLTVAVGYYPPGEKTPIRELTYTVNLDHAKSVFRLDCANGDCVRGDHELTEELAQAVAKRSKTVAGEQCCQGWLSKDTIQKTKCGHVMRYKMTLRY